ncbi:MAG: ECF transporter S component [Caldicoprobacterales bacterium]|nr:ECF transporter S component [Clostridiales bacterium]
MIDQKSIKEEYLSPKIYTLNGIVKIALLSAIAFILMLLELPLPLFPAFLKIDLSDLPALIGGFALGPVASIIIQLIKNILHFIFKNDGTGGAGNLANFIVGISFTVPAAIIYIKNRTKKGALIGMVVGTISLIILASLANYFVLIPLYAKLYSMDVVMDLMTKANNFIVDVKTYVIFAVVPFNLIKAIFTSVITLLIYKKVSPLLK